MGSVTKRIRRNVMAKNMATRAGICMPIIRVGKTSHAPSLIIPIIHYRTRMLKTLKSIIAPRKTQHDQYQKQEAVKEHHAKANQNFKKSWLRRMVEKVMPSRGRER